MSRLKLPVLPVDDSVVIRKILTDMIEPLEQRMTAELPDKIPICASDAVCVAREFRLDV